MSKESKFSLPLYGEKRKSGPWCAGFWQYPPTSCELAPCVVYNAVWPRFPPATQTRFLFSFSPFYPHTLVEPLAVISFSSQLIYGVAGGAGGYFYVCKPRAFLLPCLLPVAMEGSEFISFTYHLSTLPASPVLLRLPGQGCQVYQGCLVPSPTGADRLLTLASQPCFGPLPCGSVVKNLSAVQEMQETWVRSLGRDDALEQEMAKHSSILAWKILQSKGSRRVGLDWAHIASFTHLNGSLGRLSKRRICITWEEWLSQSYFLFS